MIERLIAVAAALAFVVGGVLAYGHHQFTRGRAAERADYEAAAQLQREAVRKVNLTQEIKAVGVDRDQVQRTQVRVASIAAARTEQQRVRDEVSARASVPGAAACTRELERARTAERLFAESTAAYIEVAAAADALADRLRGYQALDRSDTIAH